MTDQEIEEKAIKDAMKVWKGQVVLPYVHCSYCPPDQIKQHCVCNVVEGTAMCARHWIERRVRELKAAEFTVKEPFPVAELKGCGLTPLDVDDFARL
jgi:hypothetical protein